MTLEPLRRAALLAASVSLGLSLATGAQAADEKKPKTQRPQQVIPTGEEDAPPAAARAARTAAPAAAPDEAGEANLDNMLNRSTEGLQVIRLDDGSEMVDLEGRFMHVSYALPRADGSTVASCVSSQGDLAKAKAAAAASRKPAPPAAEEK